MGCSGSKPETSKPLPSTTFATLKERIAQLRDLPFKRGVVLIENVGANADDGPNGQSPAHLALAYKRIGLLAEGVDFDKALVEYARLQRLFFYEPQSGSIVVSPQAARIVSNLAPNFPRRVDQLPAAMALALALQEQHFRWQERLNRIVLEDRRLAFQAIAYGDAVLLAQSYARSNQPQTSASAWDAITKFSAAMDHLAGRLPDLLRDKLIFPYREGSQFVNWALANKGWQGVNALYNEPPLSASQILHPERYYTDKENPRRILPVRLLHRLSDKSTVDQTLGESLVARLLSNQLSRERALRIAYDWRGDYLSVYETPQPIVVWFTIWRDEESAEAFMRAFKSLLERRHRISFEPSSPAQNQWHARLPSARAALLQRTGTTVAWLDGVTDEFFREISAESWTDVVITTEPEEFPFDSAKASRQLSRTIR